jgi:hypothetical protein
MSQENEVQIPYALAEAQKAGLIKDAAETMAFARQLENIQTRQYMKKYPELKGRSLVPSTDEDGNAVEQTTYRMWDAYVQAKIISNYATDFPTVTASAQEFSAKFKSFGASYMYSVQDMRNASRAGVPLDTTFADAARRAIEIQIEECYVRGVPEAKTFGISNHPNVPLAILPTGTWATATGEQILADLNYLRNVPANSTLGIWATDQMLIDGPSYRFIAAKPLNTANSSNQTVLQAFLAQNPGFTVVSWEQLNTADSAGTGPKIVCYKFDSEAVEFRMGQDFETFPLERRGMAFITPCHARAAGVVVRHPLSLVYADNHA